MIKNKNVFHLSMLILPSVLIINVILTNYNYFQEHTGTILSIPMWNTRRTLYNWALVTVCRCNRFDLIANIIKREKS